MEMILEDEGATARLGARLARALRPGDAVLLAGPLGAGKSALARAVLRAMAGDGALEVPSPTFTLLQTYDMPGGVAAHHFDLYRLVGPEALHELGWDDAMTGIALVEWPDRLGRHAPPGALRVALEPLEGDARRATLEGWEGRPW